MIFAHAVVVLCRYPDRMKVWSGVLSPVFDRVYAVGDPDGYQRIAASVSQAAVEAQELPESVSAVFLHAGDRGYLAGYLAKVRAANPRVFVFNMDGDPRPEPGEVPIRRRTVPSDFGISEDDVREFGEFALGRRTEWPSACLEKPSLENLQAIAILCQGFLVLHTITEEAPLVLSSMPAARREQLRVEVTDPHWWSILASAAIEKAAKGEWGGAFLNEWLDVQALLKQVRERQAVETTAVEQAYSALVKRFQSPA